MNPNLSTNLIRLRKAKEIETGGLACVLKVDEKIVQEWEYGTKMPDFEMLEKLGKFYGIEPSDFFLPHSAQTPVGVKNVGGTPQTAKGVGRFYAWLALSIGGLCLSIFLMCLSTAGKSSPAAPERLPISQIPAAFIHSTTSSAGPTPCTAIWGRPTFPQASGQTQCSISILI